VRGVDDLERGGLGVGAPVVEDCDFYVEKGLELVRYGR